MASGGPPEVPPFVKDPSLTPGAQLLAFFHYVKPLLDSADQAQKIRLWVDFLNTSLRLFSSQPHFGGEALAQLEELLEGFLFKSIFKVRNEPHHQAHLALFKAGVSLRETHDYFISCFHGNLSDLAAQAPPPFSTLSVELCQYIATFIDFNSLVQFSQTSKFFHLFGWNQMIHELRFQFNIPASTRNPLESVISRNGSDIIKALLDRTPLLSSLTLRFIDPPSPITDHIVNPLALTSLRIPGSPYVFDSILETGFFRFPNLQLLNLDDCQMPDQGLFFLDELPNLTDLSLLTSDQDRRERGRLSPKYSLSPLSYKTRLKKLRLAPDCIKGFSKPSTSTLPAPVRWGDALSEFEVLTKLTKLEALTIRRSGNPGILEFLKLPLTKMTESEIN